MIGDASFKMRLPAIIALAFAHSVRRSAILGFLTDLEKLDLSDGQCV